MPITFIDIERRKSWRITIFFFFLLFLYMVLAAILVQSIVPYPLLDHARVWLFAFIVSLAGAGIHFWFSAYDSVNRVIKSLDARSPDREDDVHRMFSNVMDELHVVTGNRKRIRGMVIPSLSLNAIAAADLRGEAVIAITEGLLSRLSRSQVEAVVCHEAHHILSGDCLETTVAASLFGTYSAIIEKLGRTPRGRISGSPAVVFAWLLLKVSHILNLFISREREYRADAASVRMTRNPVALAETLHLLSRSWRGAGFIGSGLEMLCIVNPEVSGLDEAEGLLPDLLSTHPPIKKRIDILLRMARVSINELEQRAELRSRSRMETAKDWQAGPKYYVMNPGHEWEGPFSIADLSTLPWLSPLSWITTGDEGSVDRAWKDPALGAIFLSRLADIKANRAPFQCPVCHIPLVVTPYEGTRLYQCRYCAGILVENEKIVRLIARIERPCTQRVDALARAVINDNQLRLSRQETRSKKHMDPLSCPKCRNSMNRSFYSMAHLIEVDRCSLCGLIWFDRDELDMLQCIIEHRLVPNIGLERYDHS